MSRCWTFAATDNVSEPIPGRYVKARSEPVALDGYLYEAQLCKPSDRAGH
jgi:hypothetical protein